MHPRQLYTLKADSLLSEYQRGMMVGVLYHRILMKLNRLGLAEDTVCIEFTEALSADDYNVLSDNIQQSAAQTDVTLNEICEQLAKVLRETKVCKNFNIDITSKQSQHMITFRVRMNRVKKMTVAEIEKELGYKIEIISEQE